MLNGEILSDSESNNAAEYADLSPLPMSVLKRFWLGRERLLQDKFSGKSLRL